MLSRIGNYQLIKPLGTGGMAQTFVALRKGPAGFEQRVCLKRILPSRDGDRDFVEQFMDEARLLAQLSHAGIVQVYDFGEVVGVYFMALELVDGCDLATLLRHLHGRKRRLPVLVTLHIAAKLLGALRYAHDAQFNGTPLQLVHRDISPANILLSKSGEVKLADFGIAKFAQRSHKTRTGYIKGKALYMSPEQVRAEPLDARSDLFAVGAMLYEALTGTHPFDAATDTTVLTNILKGRRRPIRTLAPELPDDVVSLVDSLLALRREDRPASAGEALAAIPAGAQVFVQERELAQLVTACANEREWIERPGNLCATRSVPVSNVMPAGRDAASSRDAERDQPPAAGRVGTIDYRPERSDDSVLAPEPAHRGVRSSTLVATAVLVSSALAICAWLALGPGHAPPPALPSPSVVQAVPRTNAFHPPLPLASRAPQAAPHQRQQDELAQLPDSQVAATTPMHPPGSASKESAVRTPTPHEDSQSDWSEPQRVPVPRRSSTPTRSQPAAVSATQQAPQAPPAARVRVRRHRGSEINEDEF